MQLRIVIDVSDAFAALNVFFGAGRWKNSRDGNP
jgi:hypothetical protein